MSCSRRCQLGAASSEMELSSSWEPSHVALDCDLAVPAPALDAASAASAAAVLAAVAVLAAAVLATAVAVLAAAVLAAAAVVLAAALTHFAAACPLAADLLPTTLHAAFAVQEVC